MAVGELQLRCIETTVEKPSLRDVEDSSITSLMWQKVVCYLIEKKAVALRGLAARDLLNPKASNKRGKKLVGSVSHVGSSTERLTVVLCEDNEVDQLWFQSRVLKAGLPVDVIVAVNGTKALALLRQIDVDVFPVLFLDINMPGMSGLEVLMKIRADEGLKQLPVFMLTSSPGSRDMVRAFSFGVQGYILKGEIMDRPDDLVHLLRSFCECQL